MKARWMLPLAALLSLAAVPCFAQPQIAVEPLAFMAGCWEERDGETLIQEQWMAPAGGKLLGMSRTLKSGRVQSYEHMLIEVTNAGVDFIAWPSGQARTRFALARQNPRMVEFSNPAHDFPTTVRYTLMDDGGLLAQIEGPAKETLRVISFRYRPASCPG